MQLTYDELDRIKEERWIENSTATPTTSIATTTQGGPANEVQRVGFNSGSISGGTFTLTFDGGTTAAITYNATAAQVQSALEALSTVGTGNVAVAKLQDQTWAQEWRLTFQNGKGATNVVQTTVDSTNIVGMGSPTNIQATDTQGGQYDEVQTVSVTNAGGGTFRLAYNGQTTAPMASSASAATVESTLEALYVLPAELMSHL